MIRFIAWVKKKHQKNTVSIVQYVQYSSEADIQMAQKQRSFTYAVLRCYTKTSKQKAMPIGRFSRNYNNAIYTTTSIIFRVLAIRMGMVQNDEQTADWCFGRRSRYSEFKIIYEPRLSGWGVGTLLYICVCVNAFGPT